MLQNYLGTNYMGSRNMLQRIKYYCTRPIILCLVGQLAPYWEVHSGTMSPNFGTFCCIAVTRIWLSEWKNAPVTKPTAVHKIMNCVRQNAVLQFLFLTTQHVLKSQKPPDRSAGNLLSPTISACPNAQFKRHITTPSTCWYGIVLLTTVVATTVLDTSSVLPYPPSLAVNTWTKQPTKQETNEARPNSFCTQR
jgi:hypothetical protein